MATRPMVKVIRPILRLFDVLKPFGDLVARCWVAWIFFRAGMVKIGSWSTTIALFTHEYTVPFLPPYMAAVLGTAAELILPVLLVIGFGGRISVFIFFCYNAIALFSYDFLWTPDGAAGFAQHVDWGMLLLLLMLHGPGKFSLDNWLLRRNVHHFKNTSILD